MIGAGQVMKSICKFLSENDYSSVTMFNRTLSHATDLMIPLGGHAHDLEELIAYRDGFDVLIVCTASTEPIITSQVYKALTAQSAGDKMIVDLALPANVADDVAHLPGVTYLGMEQIRQEVSRNVTDREEALLACLPIIQEAVISFRSIFRQRQIEIRMSEIPTAIKQIRTTALKEVFAADVEQLDEKSKEVLNNIVDYFEKKYISVPMKLAREVLLDASSQNTSPQ
jgi:glutamyl-tRNA reductase